MRSPACSACGFHALGSSRSRSALETEGIAHLPGPVADRKAMMPEQRQRDALHAEADTGGMRHFPGRGLDLPRTTKQVTVIIEADARRRAVFRGDRHQQLELQRLLALAGRQQLAGTAEERIVGDVYTYCFRHEPSID